MAIVGGCRAWSAAAAALVLLAACTGGAEDPVPSAPATDPAAESGTAPAPSATASPSPVVRALQAVALAAGDQHACALDEAGAAWCWGYNRFGQLGNGTRDDSTSPVAVAGDHRFTRISAGRYFTCALDTAGAPWCWGDNSRGQLGDGRSGTGSSDRDRDEPVRVLGDLTLTELATGQLHACGLTESGEAWCWGAYPSGQLGNDSGSDQTRPGRSAAGIELVSLTAAGANTCGLDARGRAWCWGNNSFGQLGNGVTDNRAQPTPARVDSDVRFTSIAVGVGHVCALDGDDAAWCWGDNRLGQLADGTSQARLRPVPVEGDHTFDRLAAGTRHTCGLDVEARAWCWGDDGNGQLGAASGAAEESEPVAVAGSLSYLDVAPGEEFTCGLSVEDQAYCWGSNRSGWLGDGTKEDRAEPTPVVPVG